ncbi:hypothetical protein N473_26420 [Pseudoalteromonas luteoviolacea CPMOR-1]|uniref:Uncharacterized protein n=1 Tax=Pseudoalteromonas luteoviolacea CPMOR-1 TaxID=1365248 RepID=A0A167HRJ7_9GAMM|nr:hypothetical protein [Pseudoalteromonas luteoviolacea]KZN58446.1 hypothetical protein N473_26420 [Pseudoalteromonas luteoviolacea CPMOR-1]
MINISFSRAVNKQHGKVTVLFEAIEQLIGIESHTSWNKQLKVKSDIVLTQNERAQIQQQTSIYYTLNSNHIGLGIDIYSPVLDTIEKHMTIESRELDVYEKTLNFNYCSLPSMQIELNVAQEISKDQSVFKLATWSTFRDITKSVDFGSSKGELGQVYSRIYYGPSNAAYICEWPFIKKGVVKLIMGREKHSSKLVFGTTKQCFLGISGGLIRSDDDIPTIDRKIPIEPQLQSSYIMQPTITCKRLSDNTDIIISSFSYSISRGQFAATGSIKFCSKIDMERALNNELLVSVNGYQFIVICEQPNTSLKFGSNSFSASIRSRFALLSSPYSRAGNYTNSVNKTFAGLLSDALVNTGWILKNKMVDFNVPPNAFSYRELTPAGAVLRIAQSVGAILDFDDVKKEVSIIPEWPVNPWDTETAVCDVILNESLILEHSCRETINQENNAVFVRGEQQGVACKIKRRDTLGDQYASDIVDSLITDNQAARQRGTCELARSGNKKESTIRTKLLSNLPPIRPGMLVGIRYTDSLYKATCDSVSITASTNARGAITVNQTINTVSNV